MGVTVPYKKATGDYYIWICYKNQRTTRKVGKDKKLALKAGKMYREQLVLGKIDWSNGRDQAKQELTFGAFFKEYLEHVAKHKLKFSSWSSYKQVVERHLIPVWGTIHHHRGNMYLPAFLFQ